VVALYESFFSILALLGINIRLECSRYADMNIIYCNSPVEHIQDIYIPAAKSFLTSYSCYKAARTVAGLMVTVTNHWPFSYGLAGRRKRMSLICAFILPVARKSPSLFGADVSQSLCPAHLARGRNNLVHHGVVYYLPRTHLEQRWTRYSQ
jgi:hypothetical protein